MQREGRFKGEKWCMMEKKEHKACSMMLKQIINYLNVIPAMVPSNDQI